MANRTPIYSALIKYAKKDYIRLHMPGHIGQADNLVKELQQVAVIDVTEVPGIDDLHLPVSHILEAEKLLAEAFKADKSMFLVNGATSGIQALFLALGEEGKKVLIPRNAHRSFYGGLVLSGLMPEYLPCEIEPDTGIALSVAPQTAASAIKEKEDIIGIFLTSPSFYGTTLKIKEIAAVCKENNLPLFIDEAHGSHFPFHEAYPVPALWQGADAVVNGLHKTWPVLNQGAALHIASSYENEKQLRAALSLVTTTSPSFPILASMDLARALMQQEGRSLLDQALGLSNEYKKKINEVKGLKVLAEELKYIDGVAEIDPLKVLISVKGLSINGYEVASILHKNYNIQIELSEESVILAMFSMFHTRDDWEKFYRALADIAVKYRADVPKGSKGIVPPRPTVIFSPRQAYFSKKRTVPLEESAGLVSGEMVAAYPPGIPCILPGELITKEVIEYLEFLRTSHIRIQGPKDKELVYIDIIE